MAETRVADSLGRPVRDLRVSVTDRCNFRCTYCMPKEIFGAAYRFLPKDEILTFEEISRLVRLFAGLGVQKVRITGGEPLVRAHVEDLVARLASIEGVRDLAMTTNGSLLTPQKARALKEAGLRRVSVSLDSLDDDVFRSMNDVGFPVAKVLGAIDAALEAGLTPVKVNMVVKRGVNESSILPMAEHFRNTSVVLRFIEFMDVGSTNGWRLEDVVGADEILEVIGRRWPLEALAPARAGEVARRFRYQDGKGEIGMIASVTKPFCSGCTRARLTPEGLLYTCLFGTSGHDLRALLRSGASDDAIQARLRAIWVGRSDRYSEIRTSHTPRASKKRIEMSHIGG